jgi:AraC-like DNA-binding protein
MTHTTPDAAVRAEWLERVVAQCQLFAGDAVLLGAPDEVIGLAAGFSERLAKPASHVEHLVLRALLIELAIRWSTLLHSHAHYGEPVQLCPFTGMCALDHLCDHAHQKVTDGFVEWARAFSADFVETHPITDAQRVCAILRRPSQESLGTEQLAELVGVTPARLRRAFRRERGMALPEYLRRVRLLRALQTLVDERHKIEPVSLEAGYRSKKSFYRVFRQLTGMTPMEFRQLPAESARQIIEKNRIALLGDWRR